MLTSPGGDLKSSVGHHLARMDNSRDLNVGGEVSNVNVCIPRSSDYLPTAEANRAQGIRDHVRDRILFENSSPTLLLSSRPKLGHALDHLV